MKTSQATAATLTQTVTQTFESRTTKAGATPISTGIHVTSGYS